MVERPIRSLVAILGLVALACFQETSVADVHHGPLVTVVDSVSAAEADLAALALSQLGTEGEAIAQVEAINKGRFQPYWAGRSSEYAQ